MALGLHTASGPVIRHQVNLSPGQVIRHCGDAESLCGLAAVKAPWFLPGAPFSPAIATGWGYPRAAFDNVDTA